MSIRWLAFLLSANLAVSVAQEDIELTKEELAATLVGLEVSEISESPVSGVYEVAVGSNVAYVTSDGRYLLQGDLYDLTTNENITDIILER